MKNNYYIKNLNCSKNRHQNLRDHLLTTHLVTALQKKNILVSSLNYSGNEENKQLELTLFFRTQKLKDYKLKAIRNTKNLNSKTNKIIFKTQNLFQGKTVNFKIQNLNTLLTDQQSNDFCLAVYKDSSPTLFVKRAALYCDFLKITTLIVNKQISVWAFVYVLSLIFKKLQKRKHTVFTSLIPDIFEPIIKSENSSIIGIKFILSGRIKGKPMASFVKFNFGKISLIQENLDIQHAQTHIYTMYGCFGLKLWINYKK